MIPSTYQEAKYTNARPSESRFAAGLIRSFAPRINASPSGAGCRFVFRGEQDYRRILEKIQWFVTQDQSGIRKKLLCISARVRSVPCSCLVKGEVGYGVTSSARAADGLRGRRAASASRCLASDRQPPAGVAALRQAEMSLRARDPPWALLVPALARAGAAAKAVRSKGATGC